MPRRTAIKNSVEHLRPIRTRLITCMTKMIPIQEQTFYTQFSCATLGTGVQLQFKQDERR